jgi:hypothetical protein
MIAFIAFMIESYYAQNSMLIIDECKRMIKIARYMIQKKFADFMIKRHHAINERLKRIWSWIKKDKIWKEFDEKFDEFENDYSLSFFELELRVKVCVVRRKLKK